MINPMDLSGKNILVTGASSGIGRGIAIYLSNLGANIIMVARNEERLKKTFIELVPGDHSYYGFDLTKTDEIAHLMNNICTDSRKLHGLVHSAGISKTIPLHLLKLDDLNNIMTINFYSFMELVKDFSKRKYNDNGGSIVAVSSISSRVGARGLSAYCASKGALESAIRALALDLVPKNIRINSVQPGMIGTDMYNSLKDTINTSDFETELKKRQILGIGKPDDVSSAVAYLLSDSSRFITGSSIIVDGGYTTH